MEEEKLSEIISSLQSESESLRERINADEHVVCTHAICEACNQRNIEVNASKESLMVQLREKESLIQKLSE